MLLTDQELANQVRQTVTTASSDLQEILSDLKAGRGPAGLILRDEAVATQIRDAVKNAQQATASLDRASHQADALVSDLNSRQIPQQAAELVDNLADSARQVHQVISDIATTDEQGMTAGANVRVSLTNANTASSNLADATEALKHNFLVRGFFKKRGYYNLADLTPETYRKDKAFTSSANRRVWLSASELFESSWNGEEELSAQGKALLNAKLMEHVGAGTDGPMVVEGYWNGGVPADQLWLSRSRAMVVRQYLQTQFHLDARDLGVVPMKNSPPKGLDHATWDGVCIVILKPN
jgi:phospholipid/cholesterol/gamma-HCH transport system substrate-binding protein